MSSNKKDPLIGKLFDEYRLESLLGKGGMARVYRAIDERLNRYVAIKVIEARFQSNDDYAQRFEREATAIGKLNHPGIVSLYRYGEVEGRLYMAMEYVNGKSLRFVLDSFQTEGTHVRPDDIARLTREMCDALDYAHSQGVIHRDIKSSNIMLDREGHAHLTDFGLVLLTDVGTMGEVFGSPHYIAPEQVITSAGAVPQTDLYALGVILYEMFTGGVPFDSNNPLVVARMHLTDPPQPPRERRKAVSAAVEAVILKAMEKEVDDRYPNGAALADALEQAVFAVQAAEAPTLVGRRSIPERIVEETDRFPLPPVPAAASLGTEPGTEGETLVGSRMRMASQPKPPTAPGRQKKQRRTRRINWLVLLPIIGLIFVLTAILLIMLIPGVLSRIGLGSASDFPLVGLLVAPTAATPETVAMLLDETATPLPTETNTPEPPPSELLTITGSPTPTATVTPTGLATDGVIPAGLLLVKGGDDSLFIVNQSGQTLSLEDFKFGDGKASVKGKDWDVDVFEDGQCVTVWKDSGNPQAPNLDQPCQQTGKEVERKNKDRFWTETFSIYYNGEEIAECDANQTTCTVDVPALAIVD